MPDGAVTVAIPVRDGGEPLHAVLAALARQTVPHELLVADSGSRDGSAALAREHGARVIEIAPGDFAHGPTRNLLVAEARGAHVALLTQDAEPADERWLERLLAGFAFAPRVGLVYGPYRPRPGAPLAVRLELDRWFRSLAPDGAARVDRLRDDERERVRRAIAAGAGGGVASSLGELVGARGFFTDANACLARSAWEQVPYRRIDYAEDRALALDMLAAGYAKVYVPDAAVLHSHAYSGAESLRRAVDEWRGLADVYGWREPLSPRRTLAQVRGELGAARRELDGEGVRGAAAVRALAGVAGHHAVRRAGAILGSRADRMPTSVRRALSLERRGRAGPPPLEDDASAVAREEPPA
ncbi:MAG TPA: glycosyltransferase [Solirubrobacteraceae bacterium]|nr:glycosyltransferase [Solirubrobacteraceae bacterium]